MHMQFSENPKNRYFFSQPHQPFFVLAFINAIVTMLVFLLSYKGVLHLAITPSSFHAYGITYLMFTPAFLAFLFTTFPRFTSTEPIEVKSYMSVFSLYYLGAILYLLGSIVTSVFSGAAMLLIFVGHFKGMLLLRKFYLTTSMEDKQDIYWILLAMKLGLFSHLLFIIAELFYMPLMGLSIEISIYLYLFLLTFTVAQRMIPFFSHSMIEKNEKLFVIVFSLLVLHIILEGIVTHSSFIVDLVLAYIIGKELLRWKLLFPNPNPMLFILHIAMYWIPIAFILAALSNLLTLITGANFLFLDIHVLMLGFVFTILIGFGTRVTIGHSGNIMQADNWVKVLFIWTQVVVIVRILTSFVSALGWNFMVLFDISATVWMVMFIVWAIRFFAVLINGKKLTQ
ncbi:MAG: NnrS family protein [Sulfurovum sp.]|uniref:NnrS family protein n=1 Tax=Sulfurovum sp. TaxID=1969726 RepID=UPI002867FC98|nr:NnrS family protein [Sulfurovum sp.]MCO4844731.1 NnrS family protein [Sulfurovum sp.]